MEGEGEKAAAISAKFAIAIASVHKYANTDTELWKCTMEMLKWSLKQ